MNLKYILPLVLVCNFIFSQNYHDTQGKLEVSGSGQAIFTLPIAMPPSIQSIGPTINLVYASGQLGGIAGQGWSINGMSVISRISTRIDIDGFIDGVDFDDNDKLALDGQRLLLVSGTYWHDGSIYETEVQSNTKIVLKIYSNQTYFIVTTPDGSKTWYGLQPGSNDSLQNGIDTTAWYIVASLDTDGNYVKFRYNKDCGVDVCHNFRIHEILFSANLNSNVTPLNKIKFEYNQSPRTENYFLNGKKYVKTVTLKEITASTGDLTFKKYTISHVNDPQLGYQRVSSIQEFNGNNEPANPILFEYDTTTSSNVNSEYVKSYTNNIEFNVTNFAGDFDGDSRLDFVANGGLYLKVFEGAGGNAPVSLTSNMMLAGGKSFAATTLKNNKLNQAQSIIRTHKTDTATRFSVFDLENNTFTNSYTKEINIQNLGVYGDPIYDTFYCTENDCTDDVETILSIVDENGFPYYNGCNTNNTVKNRQYYYEGDFNGDGISEVFIVNDHIERKFHYTDFIGENGGVNCMMKDEIVSSSYYLLDLNPNKSTELGTSGFVQFTTNLLVNPNNKFEERFFSDFNGDGKTDMLVLSRNNSSYGNYKVFEFKQLTVSPWVELVVIGEGNIAEYGYNKTMLFGDYNGDGKTDIMIPDSSGGSGHTLWHIYYSNPKLNATGLFESESHNIVEYWPNSGTYFDSQTHFNSYYALDVNKDGKTDLVKVWRKIYKPDFTINDHNTQWNISTYVNNIGNTAVTGNKFTLDYTSPCQTIGFITDCEHDDGSPDLPIPLTSSFRHNSLNNEMVMIRDHTNTLTYINFNKDVTRDATLKKVTQSNGAIINEIDYNELETNPNVNNGYNLPTDFYSSTNEFNYPLVELKQLPNSKFVSKLKNTTLGTIKYQDFKYQGYTVALNGYGLIGFKKTARSSWYTSSSPKIIWTATEIDPLMRGATKRTYSKLLNSTELFSFETSYTAGLMNKVENTYIENTDPITHRYSILLDRQLVVDYTTNVTTVTDHNYTPDYLLPANTTTTNFLGSVLQGTKTVATLFENNPDEGNYYIGRPTQITTTVSAYLDTKSTIEKIYYLGNNVEHTEKTANNSSEIAFEYFEYYPNGNLKDRKTRVFGPNTNYAVPLLTTSYDYDGSNRFVKTTIAPDLMQTKNLNYDLRYGLVTEQEDVFGLKTKFVYDNWGKRIEIEDYLGKKINYSYSRTGNTYLTHEIKDDGSESLVETDPLGRVTRKGSMDINGNWNYSSTEYDALGRKYRESEIYRAGTSPSQWITYQYDDYDRVIEVESYTGKTITNTYDGLAATTTDGILTKKTIKNANGHIVSTEDTPGGEILYTYFANGNLKESNYEGAVLTMTYDNWGRKTSLNDPSAGLYTYEYDYYGQILTETTPKGTTTYEYDDFGKILTKTVEGTTTAENTSIVSTYTYDPNTKLLTNIDVINTYDGNSSYIYEYDPLSKKVIKTTENLPAAIFEKRLTYDEFGRVQIENNIAIAFGKESSKKAINIYKRGALWKIMDGDDSTHALWELNTVTAKGQLAKAIFGNGVAIGNEYDSYHLPTKTRHISDTVDGRFFMLSLDTQFEPVRSNLISRTNLNFNISEGFEYDALDRLTKINSGNFELLNATFTETNEGFSYYGVAGSAQLHNQKLKVESIGLNAGVSKKFMQNALVGETIAMTGVLNKTVGQSSISAKIRELDPSTEAVLNEQVLGEVGSGAFDFEYVVLYDNSNLELAFENDEVTNPNPSNPAPYFDPGTGVPVNEWSNYTLDDVKIVKLVFDEQTYDDKGRITNNPNTGSYDYSDSAHPYRVTSVTLNPSSVPYFTANNDLKVTYNAFKSPISIDNSGNTLIDYEYNVFQHRSAMYYGSNDPDKFARPLRRIYSSDGSIEIDYDSNTGVVQFTTFIGGDAYSAPIVYRVVDENRNFFYLHRDHLGSILAVSNEDGRVQEERFFDAWGKLVEVRDSSGTVITEMMFFDRGYTGHEHLESVGLIHMNGRLYDPEIRRFLQPDNFVQDPYNTQNYNRYSYVLNNPLKYNDPSGELIDIGLAIGIGALIAATTYTLTALLADVPFTVKGLITSVAISVISSSVTFGIGEGTSTIANFALRSTVQAVSHGTFQGGMTAIQGGKFWTGFAAGSISSAAASLYSGVGPDQGGWHGIGGCGASSDVGMLAFGTISGGAGSALTGGNFWQGAVTGLVVSGLNHLAHQNQMEDDSLGEFQDNGDYHPKPDPNELHESFKVKKGTVWQNRGGRPSMLNSKGEILEWDSQHGEVEKYNPNLKKHLGGFNPKTGTLRPGSIDPGRRPNRGWQIQSQTKLPKVQNLVNPTSIIKDFVLGGPMMIMQIEMMKPGYFTEYQPISGTH